MEFWETYNVQEILPNLQEANAILAQILKVEEVETLATEEAVKTEEPAKPTSKLDSLKSTLKNNALSKADSLKNIEKLKRENPLFAVLSVGTSFTKRFRIKMERKSN
ncbi:MAG: hypothetical protein CR965_02545 [Paludibacter sp.]|nr:MAG: hypothetical protein CR965_02545 [Paludibacter sp.]